MIDKILKTGRILAATTSDTPTAEVRERMRAFATVVADYFNPGRSESHCRACSAPIIWVKTAAGKNAPLDAVAIDGIDTNGDARRVYLSHFATCPQARKFAPGGNGNGKTSAGR